MNVQSALKNYGKLKKKLYSGKMDERQFKSEVDKLTFKDSKGRWQKISYEGEVLTWDGSSWQKSRSGANTGPENLLQLIKLFVKNLPRSLMGSFKRKFILLIAVTLIVWIVHTYLLIGPNGGFAPGTNKTLDNILALRGRMLSGTLFWMIVSGLLFGLVSRIQSEGAGNVFGSLKDTIADFFRFIISNIKSTGARSLTIFLLGAAAGIVFSLYIKSTVVMFLLAVSLLFSLSEKGRGLIFLVVKLTLSDLRRVLKIKKKVDAGGILAFFYGSIIGFVVSGLLYQVGILLWIALIVFAALAIFNATRKTPSAAAGMFFTVLGATLFYVSLRVFADDGGLAEAPGGNLAGWVGSEGSTKAVTQGLGPAVGSGAATAVATTVPDVLNDAVGDGEPVTTQDKAEENPADDRENPDEGKDEAEQKRKQEEKAEQERKEKERKEHEKREREKREREKREKERLEKERLEKIRKEEARRKRIQELREQQKKNIEEMERLNRKASWWDRITTVTEYVKKGCDVSVDLLSNVTGPVGKGIKNVYTVATNAGEGLGKSMAEGGNYTKNIMEGTTKGISDAVEGNLNGKIKAIYQVGKGVVKETYKNGLSLKNFGKGFVEGTKDAVVDKVAGDLCDKVPGLKKHDMNTNYGKQKISTLVKVARGKSQLSDNMKNLVRDKFTKATTNTVRGETENFVKSVENNIYDYAKKKAGFGPGKGSARK